jgi:hypothetical protein
MLIQFMNLHVKSDRDDHYGASGATPPVVLPQSASTLSKPDDRAVDRDWKVKSSDDSGPPLSSEEFDITHCQACRFNWSAAWSANVACWCAICLTEAP